MAVFTLINSRLSVKYGAKRTIRFLLIAYTLVAGILLFCTVAFNDPPDIRVFFVAIALLMAINLAVEPNSSALAMEPMGNMAGLASALYGTFFFSIGASLGSIISYLMTNRVLPLV